MRSVSSSRKNESFVYRCIMRQKLETADIIRRWIGKFLRIDLIVSATRVTKARLLSVDRTLHSTKHWSGTPETLSITQAKRVSCQAKWTGSSRYKNKKLLGRIVSLSPNTFKWGVIEEYTYFVYKAKIENRNMWKDTKIEVMSTDAADSDGIRPCDSSYGKSKLLAEILASPSRGIGSTSLNTTLLFYILTTMALQFSMFVP